MRPVVDRMVGPQRQHAGHLVVAAGGGDDPRADPLGHQDRGRADAAAAGLDQDRLARQQPGIVDQHVLDRRDGDRGAGGGRPVDPVGHRNHQASRHGDELRGQPVAVESEDAADALAQGLLPGAAGPAGAADQRGVDHHPLARRQPTHFWADRGDGAGALDPDGERQLAAGN